MNTQRKLSRQNSRQSSIAETASVGSTKSCKSNGSGDNNITSNIKRQQNGLSKQHGSQDSGDSGNGSQPASILNVAEMLLHGVADSEILDIWLRSINCEEFVANFINAGYDMPTISRITPQDLTAIGITEPSKRLKILSEIKKLNLQDGIPSFRPASLSHWLSLIRLDSYYYKSLCDQQIDTIDKMCQLTWEDFEELGITKLGHQKRFQLAIERVKGLESEVRNSTNKTISEPIYDTNPSQILLVASSENHSMNGPIINKQSSTSELSSTGSGSMHSVYSANSNHYQAGSYAPSLTESQSKSMITNHNNNNNNQNGIGKQTNNYQQQQQQQQQLQQQAIYSQPPPPTMIYQSPAQLMSMNLQQQQSHYQPVQRQPMILAYQNGANLMNDQSHVNGQSIITDHNRQSMLPFRALAKLPLHQQQQLQQSSIYATLSRQPAKMKQAPPPVPIRTNSLKSNSLVDDKDAQELRQLQANYQQQQQQHLNSSTNSLFRSTTSRSGVQPNTRGSGQISTQTMLTKNKSFSGNAHMEASRARFLNRQSQQQQQLFPQQYLPQPSHQFDTKANQDNNVGSNQNIYGIRQPSQQVNGNPRLNGDISAFRPIDFNFQRQIANINAKLSANEQIISRNDEFDPQSDTNSTKSLIVLPSSSSVQTPVESDPPALNGSPDHGSGSSQTLYNSASSGGSNEQNLNTYSYSQAAADQQLRLRATASSSCTLNDADFETLDSRQSSVTNFGSTRAECNATTGKDDDFPPPPSPLSLTDSDEHDLVSSNQQQQKQSSEANFASINRSLMTFRVGI